MSEHSTGLTDAERPVLVFEFSSSQNQTGQGSDFERALKRARHLSSREASVAKTVAYIPKALKGHAVLVAMACEQIEALRPRSAPVVPQEGPNEVPDCRQRRGGCPIDRRREAGMATTKQMPLAAMSAFGWANARLV